MTMTPLPPPLPPESPVETDSRFPSGPWQGFFLMAHLPGWFSVDLECTLAHSVVHHVDCALPADVMFFIGRRPEGVFFVVRLYSPARSIQAQRIPGSTDAVLAIPSFQETAAATLDGAALMLESPDPQ